jgi:hypothetical protein
MTTRSQTRQHWLLGLLLSTMFGFGCAGSLPEARNVRAAGEWSVRLPANASPVAALAYGRGGSATPAAFAFEPASSEAQPQLAAVAAPKTVKHVRPALRANKPVLLASASQQPPTAAAPSAAPEPQLAQADSSELSRYAGRQASAQKLEQFKAGDAIVIGVSSAVVVVLIVLLIILLLR